MEPERWKHLNIAELIKQKKIWLLCSSLILSAFQKKLAQDVGVFTRYGNENHSGVSAKK